MFPYLAGLSCPGLEESETGESELTGHGLTGHFKEFKCFFPGGCFRTHICTPWSD